MCLSSIVTISIDHMVHSVILGFARYVEVAVLCFEHANVRERVTTFSFLDI